MSNPKGLITPEQAKILNDTYTPRCELVSKDITKRPDNRSIWYSLEEIENFLSYAKEQAKELGYEMDGIRIYCGAYPEEEGEAGYSTSFIIPTSSNEIGKESNGQSHDIKQASGLNKGSQGDPPNANYPQ
ncbi:hypothetical protein [Winogradskyella luteola]|uniref:Uncharacterized protein n=1 Tax=Winogradskyella luteola TaxID=2828330 RepID=A0A9X1FBD8_9FLAO|nr:hypothetical protein [Winogradskyella luteola]MBV7270501.1 hypothetical protein [Winogradskyella luteola]